MQVPDKDRLDFWLDEALGQQGNVEPHAGLESRIFSTLHTRSERLRVRRQWLLIFGSPAVAVLLIALVWHGEHSVTKTPTLKAINSVDQQSEVEQTPGKTAPPSQMPGTRDAAVVVKTSRHHPSTYATGSEPRRNHFPSPRPLSPQEVVLARYAERYPQEAALIAKEQQKFDEEVQKAQQEIESRSGISNE